MKNNNQDRQHRIKRILLCLGLAVLLIGNAMPAGAAGAQRKVKGEWILPKHYPKMFHGYGHLNRLAADESEVVIDDSLFKLSPSVTYATPTSEFASSFDFADGDLVGYINNSQQEIISLWLIRKGSP